ncbi:GNAT family N-acetyltransferase [Mucilaginibacter xinganensis]|uniref:BioF2-like acetyltransferase domain-containing protein n=1 Tax=Mucilaginibacter xinganensis TaxID=1234841 RepID=A0A223NY34_9SPHI|nr:GNAT family N-acetyltransferase [Mucilaginibacter xinganensis]ASU34726.1 hypothetical protein MuYL_2839 [Mucilaginibacter xinganensis]
MGYRSFTVNTKKEWDDYMMKALMNECFHSWGYHLLNNEGEPLLFIYEEEGFFIALPVIKRQIENSPYFDMTSVYGYSGPVSNIDLSHLSSLTISQFKISFTNFMQNESAICMFSRLHPFINQLTLTTGFGGIRKNGTTLYIDLSISVQDQHNRYDKRLSRQIRRLRKQGFEIKESCDLAEIRGFIEMYHKNMDRVSASKNYYFEEKYFVDLLNIDGFDNRLILIYEGRKLVCGALVLLSDNIIRNHLSATAPEYLKESPSKLLTDEISVMGRRLGKKIFHLGGGVGGKEDTLYRFKRLFSGLQVKDHIWCYINDEQAYNDLVQRNGVAIDPQSAYFPLYRQPKRDLQPYISNIEASVV